MKRIHIFKAGTQTDSAGETRDFGDAILSQVATGYDKAKHEAPLVVGHPSADAPAYGYVDRLQLADGNLFVIPAQVNPAFSELVQAGAYKKVSASFYTPSHPNNPTPGAWYLRHVGFLGAQPPAIKGLKPIEFADDPSAVTVTADFAVSEEFVSQNFGYLFRKFREFLIEKFGLADADKALPDYEVRQVELLAAETRASANMAANTTDNPSLYFNDAQDLSTTGGDLMSMTGHPDLAAQKAVQAKLDIDRAAFDKEKADFAEAKAVEVAATAKAKRIAQVTEAAAFADAQVKAGKLVADQRRVVAATLVALSDLQPVQFGEGEPAIDLAAEYRKAIEAKAQQVQFGEQYGTGVREPNTGNGDPLQEAHALHAQAVEFAEKHKITTVEALMRINATNNTGGQHAGI